MVITIIKCFKIHLVDVIDKNILNLLDSINPKTILHKIIKTTFYRLWKLNNLMESAKMNAKSTAIPATTPATTPRKSCSIPKELLI